MKTRPYITERLLMGRKNQIKQISFAMLAQCHVLRKHKLLTKHIIQNTGTEDFVII